MKLKCDLHVHSVLSGCASRDNGVLNVVNMAGVCGMEVLAIADHNSAANVQAASEAARQRGILLVPAIEVTTAEDIHVLCYFRSVEDARTFSWLLSANMLKFPLDERLYFPQVTENAEGAETGRVDYFLGMAADFGIYALVEDVRKLGGICVPAHVDKSGNGIIDTLGTVPDDLGFTAVEITPNCPATLKAELEKDFIVLTNSDAHCLEDIAANESYIEMKAKTIEAFFNALTRKSF